MVRQLTLALHDSLKVGASIHQQQSGRLLEEPQEPSLSPPAYFHVIAGKKKSFKAFEISCLKLLNEANKGGVHVWDQLGVDCCGRKSHVAEMSDNKV